MWFKHLIVNWDAIWMLEVEEIRKKTKNSLKNGWLGRIIFIVTLVFVCEFFEVESKL